MAYALRNAMVFGKLVDIEIDGGKITKVGKSDAEAGMDVEELNVVPGLIDTHIHGCMGCDTMDGDMISLGKIAEYLFDHGITSWLPTTMTMDMEKIKAAVSRPFDLKFGAAVLGYHMEGPYINETRKGAQNAKFIKAPDIDDLKEMPLVKKITLAPELPGAAEFIEKCGRIVSLGHTDADYDCAKDAFSKGAKCLTHTFNAMPPFHHRNPGPIGAAIDSDAYVEVICDGLHLSRSAVMMLYRTFGADRMILVSDSMRATGLSDGEYEFGGQRITVKDSVARCEDGTIAGSTTNLFDCVKKAMEFGIPAEDAFKMASETPAKLLGVKKGKIEVGYDADLLITDKNYNILMKIRDGVGRSPFKRTREMENIGGLKYLFGCKRESGDRFFEMFKRGK